MDNCFTGRRCRSRQMPEKDVLKILPAEPVTECAFTSWRIVLPSCLDSVMSASFFVWRMECADVFSQRDVFEVLQRIHPFYKI